MTANEEDTELANMIRERAQLRRSLACLKNKLTRFRTVIGQAQMAIDDFTVWELAGGALIVQPPPGVFGGGEKNGIYPSPEELGQALKDRVAFTNRLAEIEQRLKEAG